MENNEMSFEEWYEITGRELQAKIDASQEITKDEVQGNPYGAGRYGIIRSSLNSNAMIAGEDAEYNAEYSRWFEYRGCGYACEEDGWALEEQDDLEIADFHNNHPTIKCRETYFEMTYGNTREEIATAHFLLLEYSGKLHRDFSFDLTDVSVESVKECVDSVEAWHCTGELKMGNFSTRPCDGPWKK